MAWEDQVVGKLGRRLVQAGIISRMQYVEAFVLAHAGGKSVEDVLLDKGYASPEQFEQIQLDTWRIVKLA